MNRRDAFVFCWVFFVGGLFGVLYYALSWRYHLPYIGINWLGPLMKVDGEQGYDAMLYESFIDFGLICGTVVSVVRRAILLRRENAEQRIKNTEAPPF